jgi:hypothetical protein
MCVAELNVSTLPCRHRWYHLVRPCSRGTNLFNCPAKLGLEGWEIKCDFCPYCADWNIDDGTYRLVGNDASPSIGGLSRSSSMALSTHRRESRRGSITRSDSSASITVMAASEKNRALNARVDAYLGARPDRMVSLDLRRSDTGEDEPGSPTDSNSSGGDDKASVNFMSRGWKKSKRISMSIFK